MCRVMDWMSAMLVACGAPQMAAVPATGEYAGTYSVPVDDELAEGATFAVASYEWRYDNGVATLGYSLPLELLGKSKHVSFSGPFDAETQTGTLTGNSGVAECRRVGSNIECREDMNVLKPLPYDLDKVRELAPPNLVEQRAAVSGVFINDPIGIATFPF